MKAFGTMFAIFSCILMALADNEQTNGKNFFGLFKIPSKNALHKDQNFISIPVNRSKKTNTITEETKPKQAFKSPYSSIISNIRDYVTTSQRGPASGRVPKRPHKEDYTHTIAPAFTEPNFNKFPLMYKPLICNEQIPCVLTPIMLQILTIHVPPKPLPELIYQRNPTKQEVHIKPVLPTQFIYCYKHLREDGSATNYELNRKGDVIVYETVDKIMSPPYVSEENNKHSLVDRMNKGFHEHVNSKQYESSSVIVKNNEDNYEYKGTKIILKKNNIINNNKGKHEHATVSLEDENKIKGKTNIVTLKPKISWKDDPIVVADLPKYSSTKLRGINSNMESFEIEHVTDKQRRRGDIPEE